MFDQVIREYTDPLLNKTIQLITKTNVTPNQLTVIGIGFGIACFTSIFFNFYMVALLFLTLNRIFDGLDGLLARSLDKQGKQGSSDFGGYFDIIADFIFYSGFIFFFTLGANEFLLSATFLLFSFFGTGSTFLTYAIFENKNKVKLKKYVLKNKIEKSFYYIGGLTEGSETILCFVLMCLFPSCFNIFAYIFGLLCWITTATRGWKAYQTLQ